MGVRLYRVAVSVRSLPAGLISTNIPCQGFSR